MKTQRRVLYILKQPLVVGLLLWFFLYSTENAMESFLSGKMHMCNSLVRHADLKPQRFDHI